MGTLPRGGQAPRRLDAETQWVLRVLATYPGSSAEIDSVAALAGISRPAARAAVTTLAATGLVETVGDRVVVPPPLRNTPRAPAAPTAHDATPPRPPGPPPTRPEPPRHALPPQPPAPMTARPTVAPAGDRRSMPPAMTDQPVVAGRDREAMPPRTRAAMTDRPVAAGRDREDMPPRTRAAVTDQPVVAGGDREDMPPRTRGAVTDRPVVAGRDREDMPPSSRAAVTDRPDMAGRDREDMPPRTRAAVADRSVVADGDRQGMPPRTRAAVTDRPDTAGRDREDMPPRTQAVADRPGLAGRDREDMPPRTQAVAERSEAVAGADRPVQQLLTRAMAAAAVAAPGGPSVALPPFRSAAAARAWLAAELPTLLAVPDPDFVLRLAPALGQHLSDADALVLYQRAVAAGGGAPMRLRLGVTLSRLGRPAEAAEHLRTALPDLNAPADRAAALLHLAGCRERQGRTIEALAWYAEAYEACLRAGDRLGRAVALRRLRTPAAA